MPIQLVLMVKHRKKLIVLVTREAHALVTEQYQTLNDAILPELKERNICFLRRAHWTPAQRGGFISIFCVS